MTATGPSQTTSDAVEAIGVTKTFDAVVALDSVSLAVRPGEFFSLLGPSGCGKTTLLRIFGGFEYPTAGDVRIGGRSVVDEPPYRRRTNMIFQHLALFPHMTVGENIAFGLEMKRRPAADIRRRVDEALALVRLEGLRERRIDALSGGQCQRVAMARAMVNDPQVLLLDEPLGALDLQLRLQMQTELRRLQRSLGSTFIFVTHDQGEAITMSDRIAVMDKGRVLQVGTPVEIYQSPEHRFVAEFMGNSNFFAGRVVATTAPGFCRVDCGAIAIEGRCRTPLAPGAQVSVALRYEKVEVPASEGAAPAQGVDAEIVEITFMGPSVRFEARIGGGCIVRGDLPAGANAAALAVGQRVRLGWARENVVVLPD